MRWCRSIVSLALGAALAFGVARASAAASRHEAYASTGYAGPAQAANDRPALTVHRYRVAGQVRLLFVWVGGGDVGTARVTWQRDAATSGISLLIGTNPQLAPRHVNEWGYIQEHVHGRQAEVFGIRTLTDAESLDAAEGTVAQGSPLLFGAICSEVTPTQDLSWVTTVRGSSDPSYRRLPRLLDLIGVSDHWEFRRVARPADAAPGFLTALSRLMLASVASERGRSAPVAFVYKGQLYDLTLRQSEPLAELRIGSSTFHDLIRARYVVRQQNSGNVASFVATHGSRGALAGVPIQVTYQPHWWLKLVLSLDDSVDVPVDPASDEPLQHQAQHLCDAAQQTR